MPLMLEDGTLYGVLGVELLDDYVGDSLPYDELGFGTDGTYMLALFDKGTNRATLKMVSGKTRLRRGETIALTPGKDGSYAFEQDGKKIVTQMDRLTVYDMYAPFDSETWVLMGATTAQSLYAFSKRVSRMILLAIALMLIFDAAGSVLIARRLSKRLKNSPKKWILRG